MDNKKEFFDKLQTAGDLILNSEPFANQLEFFKAVDEAHPKDKPGFSDFKHQAQYNAMKLWAESISPKFHSLGADLSWHIDISSYSFMGSGGPSAGVILADFPIKLNLHELPPNELSKTAGVQISLNHDNYQGVLSFRQQYGEPFLDNLIVSKQTNTVSKEKAQEFANYSIEVISEVEPLEELAKRGEYGYSSRDEPDFFFKPKLVTLDDLTFIDGKVFVSEQKIVADYLANSKGRDFAHYNVEEIDVVFPFAKYIETKEGKKSDGHVNNVKDKIFQAFVDSYKQRNLKVAEILTSESSFEPLNNQFYVLFRDETAERKSPTSHHFNPDYLASGNQKRLFPKTYLVKFGKRNEAGERDFSITYRRESFGDYCIWMRPDNAMDKVVDIVSKLDF